MPQTSCDILRQKESNMGNERSIVLVDDDKTTLIALQEMCTELQIKYHSFLSPIESLNFIRRMGKSEISMVICDFQMPEMNGIELMKKIQQDNIDIPIILITAHGSAEIGVNALEFGAYDYITKPINFTELAIMVSRVIEQNKIKDEYLKLRNKLKSLENPFTSLIGTSKVMEEIKGLILKVADTEANVLITGETGTGKEVVARLLHQQSFRKNGSMVCVNCASIPENLLESELFGHKKGAFTGADKDTVGLFREANKGTIFLDEIGDMPLNLQSKILRVIQEGKLRPVGADREIEIDVRVIAATHKNLVEMIQEKKFREDLFYRLNVVNIHLPPLRDRVDDIPLFCDLFLKKYKKNHKVSPRFISREALDMMMNHSWPGNIRELENTIQRACILANSSTIEAKDLIFSSVQNKEVLIEDGFFKTLPNLSELERSYLTYVLKHSNGVREKAVEILDINRKTLYRKIKEYEIKV